MASQPATFRAILPKKPLQKRPFIQAILKEAEAIAGEIELDFLFTVGTWKHDVSFTTLHELRGSTVEILVGTDDKIFAYVDQGTKPHIIKSKTPGGRLAFRSGKYRAKTSPGQLIATFGSPASGPLTRPKVVHHPGTKARKFTVYIKKKWAPLIKKRLQAAIDKQAEVSGHLLRK